MPTCRLAKSPRGYPAPRNFPQAQTRLLLRRCDVACRSRRTTRNDHAEIERELVGLIPQQTGVPDDPETMIDFIISRYHDTHRRELPELIQLARRVERVHAEHPAAPRGLAEFLTQVNADLGSHMQKEELVLFPMIRAGHPSVSAPIAAMKAEHVDHGEALEELAALTDDMQPPQGACGSWRALYAGLRKLSNDLIDHIHVENNILFPRVG